MSLLEQMVETGDDQQMGSAQQRAWGALVAAAIRAQGKSIRYISGEIGVSHNTLRDWLKGTKPADPYRFEQLSRLLNVSQADLLEVAGLTPPALLVPSVHLHTSDVLNAATTALLSALERFRATYGAQSAAELGSRFLREQDEWEVTLRPAVRGARFPRRLHTYLGLRYLGASQLAIEEQRRIIEDVLRRGQDDAPVGWRYQAPHDWPQRDRPPHILVVPDVEAPRPATIPLSSAKRMGSLAVIGPPWAHAEQVAALLAIAIGWEYRDWRYSSRGTALQHDLRGLCQSNSRVVWSLANPSVYSSIRDDVARHEGLLVLVHPETAVVDHGAKVWRETISRKEARAMARDLGEMALAHRGPTLGLRLPTVDASNESGVIDRDAVADTAMILACEVAITLSRQFGLDSPRRMRGQIGEIARRNPLIGLCANHPDHFIAV